ncbi:MAG: glycoside hydrolase family 2 TIM barrel-domain containing protein [Bacteroidota bacterium]
MKNTPFSIVLFFLLINFYHYQAEAQTTIENQNGKWSLFVDGKPFEVKGCTFGYDDAVNQYDKYFKELNYLGVNTIRTWGTGSHTRKMLDVAHSHGIKVMLGIWMRHGRPGMEADDSFDYLNDADGKEAMYQHAIETIETYKNHPAILMWGVGNEVYLNTATDDEKIAYSKLLESICSAIKKRDQNHPVVSVEAWTFGVDWWQKYVPSIDIYGINTYGKGATILPDELSKKGVDKPYVITEFGVRGEWDIEEGENGVKPEPTDEEKYQVIVEGYNEWIKPKPTCLGVYIFQYANDDRHLAPWLLTHFRGMTRPQYWAIREAYTGRKAENQVPSITAFQLLGNKVKSGSWVSVELDAVDAENGDLEVSFYYNQRIGSRKRRDQLVPLVFRGNLADGLEIQLPPVNGGIKVYAMVSDPFQNAGIATTSISVIDQKAAKRKFLVPKVELPFYIYQDNQDLPYVASAYMGNYQTISVDLDHQSDVQSGNKAIKITFKGKNEWYGLGFVDPANDWGDILGGYDISGAKTFSFWAKSNYDHLKAEIGFGLIEKGGKPFYDSTKKLMKVILTDQWKKYTIKTKNLDLTCIRSGFVLFTSGEGLNHDIYLDEIVFE